MNRKVKTVLGAVGALVLAALAVYGWGRYRDYRRAEADKGAVQALREYDRIVGDGTKEIPAEKFRPLLERMNACEKHCSEDLAELLFARRMDGVFLLGDFAEAERMIDSLPKKSDNWKTGVKAKIRAHAALARGDKNAAIGEFETFCNSLLAERADLTECDPCTGIEWSREGILARNYRRMGKLAAEIGDLERSAKFAEAAKANYAVALEKANGDEDTIETLKADFAE